MSIKKILQHIEEMREHEERIGYCGFSLEGEFAKIYTPLEQSVKGLDLWIKEDYRNKGLGRKILSDTIKIAKDKGASFFEITDVENDVLEFYKKVLDSMRDKEELNDYVIENLGESYTLHVFLEDLNCVD